MSSILFDKPSDLFYQPLPGALSHFWLTPTKAGDEPELIALNNCSDIGPRSFFAPYPYTAEHAKEAIYSRGLAISEPLATEQVKKDGKLVRKDLPLLLLDVLRDSRTMKVVRFLSLFVPRQLTREHCVQIGGAGCFQPSMPHADPVIASYESSASKPAEVNFIGYKLHPDYRGKGIITQVVKSKLSKICSE